MTPHEQAIEAVARWAEDHALLYASGAHHRVVLADAAALIAQIAPLLTGPLQAKLDAAEADFRKLHDLPQGVMHALIDSGHRLIGRKEAVDHFKKTFAAAEAEKRQAVEAAEYILDGMGIDGPEYVIDPDDDYLDAANSAWVRDTLERLAAAIRTAPVHKAGCPGTGSHDETGGRG